jgi:hypothetical protein
LALVIAFSLTLNILQTTVACYGSAGLPRFGRTRCKRAKLCVS